VSVCLLLYHVASADFMFVVLLLRYISEKSDNARLLNDHINRQYGSERKQGKNEVIFFT
jgi:hypothetical protein